jgi:hypothetical protein
MTQQAELSARTVVRDRWGTWTHPDFFKAANGNEFPLKGEFEAWLVEHNLISAHTWMASDAPDWQMDTFWASGNCASWEPGRPAGEGWFIGSIHDTEDGPVCIWLCRNPKEEAA